MIKVGGPEVGSKRALGGSPPPQFRKILKQNKILYATFALILNAIDFHL